MSLASLVVQSPGKRTTREECGRLTRDERRASPWSPSQVTLAHLSEERQPRDTGPETPFTTAVTTDGERALQRNFNRTLLGPP